MQYYFQSLIQWEQPHSFKFFVYFTRKFFFFLFYTSIFIKHSYQFIYSIHLFNKIFIFYIFIIFSLMVSLSLSLSLSDPTTIIITQSPSSRNPDLLDPSFVIFLFLILMVDQSRNPDPFKQKPKVDWSEGLLDPFKPKLTPTKRTNREWMRKKEVDQTHWSRLKRRGRRRGFEAGWKEEVD